MNTIGCPRNRKIIGESVQDFLGVGYPTAQPIRSSKEYINTGVMTMTFTFWNDVPSQSNFQRGFPCRWITKLISHAKM